MEMKGFKNAPSITEFKRGMRVKRTTDPTPIWFPVCIVREADKDPINDRGVGICGHISKFELDFDSIWEGREYRSLTGPDARATILLVGEYQVAYQIGECPHLCCCVQKDDFLRQWHPVLPAPEPPVKVEDWVHVQCGDIDYIGRIARVQPQDKSFDIECTRGGAWYGFYWNDQRVTIQKLIHAPSPQK